MKSVDMNTLREKRKRAAAAMKRKKLAARTAQVPQHSKSSQKKEPSFDEIARRRKTGVHMHFLDMPCLPQCVWTPSRTPEAVADAHRRASVRWEKAKARFLGTNNKYLGNGKLRKA